MDIRNRSRVLRSALVVVGALTIVGVLLPAPASALGFRLSFLQQPTDITAGQVFDPAVSVQVLDPLGNVVEPWVFPITVAIEANPGGGTLFGTTTVTPMQGVATFSDLTIDEAGTPYRLLATSLGAESATSTGFSVTGVALQCTTSPCELDTGTTTAANPTNGEASVPVATCDAVPCPFLSQDIVSPAQCGNRECLNNAGVVVYPPSNSTGMVTFVLENYYAPSSGGIGNRPVYLIKDDGTVLELKRCGNPPGTEACILADSATHGAVVRTTVQFPPNDPIIQK